MKTPFPILWTALLLAACQPSFEVYDLRCEGLVDPLAIDSTKPHFSWKIRSDSPMEQTAFQLQVGENVWKEESPDQVMVPYKGDGICPKQLVRWRVRVWNGKGRVSRWSPWQRFAVAPLEGLAGEYIGKGESPLLRKRFTVEKKPSEALLYVNSLGYHEAYVNGKKVSESVLQPAVSELAKRSLIVAYDVAGLLEKGENELLVAAGSGWYKPGTFGAVYEGPLVKAELDFDGNALLVTDGSWEGSPSGRRDLGTWEPHGFGGEMLDAREKPKWGPVDVIRVDGMKASAQMCEATTIQETHEARSITAEGDSCWLVDMGKVMNGLVEIVLPSLQKGQEIKIDYSDALTQEFDTEDFGQDIYIAAGEGEERFTNRFNHHVFRYARIYPLPAAPLEVKVHRIRTDYVKGGSFTSSDPRLNAIYNMLDWTLENLSFGGYMVDCASVERLGYGGDGNASTLTLQEMADAGPMYLNWLQAWADSQRPDGGLPHTAPSPYPAGGGPYWCSFLVQAAWRTYVSYGDLRPLERFYPDMKKWIEYVDSFVKDGLLRPWPNTTYRAWYLGDWAAPEGVDVQDPVSVDLVNNCALCQVFEDLALIADVLGLPEEAATWRTRLGNLRTRIHEAFYKSASASYGSGTQIDLVYPLLVGAVPEELAPDIVKTLKNSTPGYFATGLVGIPVLTEWATISGEADWLNNLIVHKGYPGYLHMLENGATGTWEHWDGNRSRLHNCFNGIGSWFYEALGGIIPLEPGCRKVRIEPQVPEGLEWVEVSRNTPYGPIRVKRNGADVKVEVPVGVTVVD